MDMDNEGKQRWEEVKNEVKKFPIFTFFTSIFYNFSFLLVAVKRKIVKMFILGRKETSSLTFG